MLNWRSRPSQRRMFPYQENLPPRIAWGPGCLWEMQQTNWTSPKELNKCKYLFFQLHFHYCSVVQFLVHLWIIVLFSLRNRWVSMSNQLNVSRALLKVTMLFQRRTRRALGLATMILSDRWDFKERRLKPGLAVVICINTLCKCLTLIQYAQIWVVIFFMDVVH